MTLCSGPPKNLHITHMADYKQVLVIKFYHLYDCHTVCINCINQFKSFSLSAGNSHCPIIKIVSIDKYLKPKGSATYRNIAIR